MYDILTGESGACHHGAMLKIWPVSVLSDNYVWVLHRSGRPGAWVVDPGQAAPVAAALDAHELELRGILLTHHHGDHVGGVAELTRRWDVPVVGPSQEHMALTTHPVSESDQIPCEALDVVLEVMEVPGHTLGHAAYFCADFVLAGDTLFAGGCGRVFEGTMTQMFDSLCRLAALPETTEVYCAHEYTAANLRFAVAVEPGYEALADRVESCAGQRARGEATVPSTIDVERRTNPFLRCSEPDVVAAAARQAGKQVAAGAETFEVIRRWKDGF